MLKTADPDVFVEEAGPGSITYRRLTDGRRWRVLGSCDRRGLCLIGSVVDGIEIRSLEHLAALKAERGASFGESKLDVPVTPEFRGCCPFRFEKLPPLR